MMYPFVSNYTNAKAAENIAERFNEKTSDIKDGSYKDALKDKKIDKTGYLIDSDGNRVSDIPVYYKLDLERLYRDSVNYNNNLKKSQDLLLVDEQSYTNPALNLQEYGIYDNIYGYVSAPSIGLKLPIFLGANDSTMSYGAAHLTYTSLPLGGESTNTVIAGHTDYTGRIFFDNLHNLKIGDEVDIKNFWTTVKYRVVRTEIHKPTDSQNAFISEGESLLTLITCIKNKSGGFDRYYVICEQI